MTVVVDPATESRLTGVESIVELEDSQGRLLGYFTPSREALCLEDVLAGISDEELNRRVAEVKQGRFFTTEQVLERLRGL